MASFSRVRAPAWAFAAARPPSEAPSLSAITGLPAARAALRVYFTRPGGRKLAHYGEREVTRLFAARSAPIALPSQPERPTPTRGRGSRHCVRSPVASSVGTDQLLGGPGSRPAAVDALAARTLLKGEPLAPPAGRADDFAWPRREVGHEQAKGETPVASVSPNGSRPVITPATPPKPKKSLHTGPRPPLDFGRAVWGQGFFTR